MTTTEERGKMEHSLMLIANDAETLHAIDRRESQMTEVIRTLPKQADQDTLYESPRDLTILALVFLLWLQQVKGIETLQNYERLALLYRNNNDTASQYFPLTAKILTTLKKEYGEDILGNTQKIFLCLRLKDIEKKGEMLSARKQRDVLFAKVCEDMAIFDPITQENMQFAGLGSHILKVCFLAYAESLNDLSYCWHEYNHQSGRGLPWSALDEALTEKKAFRAAGILLPSDATLPTKKVLQERFPQVDLTYYDYLQILFYIEKEMPESVSILEQLYCEDDEAQIEILTSTFIQLLEKTFGPKAYGLLYLCHPDYFQQRLGNKQPFISPRQTLRQLQRARELLLTSLQ